MNNKEELAWAAGLFDGEGTTSIRTIRGRWKYITITITQKDRAVLDKFMSIMGCGNVYGPYSPQSHLGRTHFQYSINGKIFVYVVLNKLWPYLSQLKKGQAMACGYIPKK